jgi:hypothetical protein
MTASPITKPMALSIVVSPDMINWIDRRCLKTEGRLSRSQMIRWLLDTAKDTIEAQEQRPPMRRRN